MLQDAAKTKKVMRKKESEWLRKINISALTDIYTYTLHFVEPNRIITLG